MQLLWINLVTDGLPALALATDPIDAGVLDRPPRAARSQIIDRALVGRTALVSWIAFGAVPVAVLETSKRVRRVWSHP